MRKYIALSFLLTVPLALVFKPHQVEAFVPNPQIQKYILAQGAPSTGSSGSGSDCTANCTFTGTTTTAGVAATTISASGLITSTVASGSNALVTTSGAYYCINGAACTSRYSMIGGDTYITFPTGTDFIFQDSGGTEKGRVKGSGNGFSTNSGPFASAVASAATAFSMLTGARFLTNGSASTRYFFDDGTNLAFNYPLKITSANNFVMSFTDNSASSGAFTGSTSRVKGRYAAAATSLVVTNTAVASTSSVICGFETNDATCKSLSALPAAGSFTTNSDAACTAVSVFSCIIFN